MPSALTSLAMLLSVVASLLSSAHSPAHTSAAHMSAAHTSTAHTSTARTSTQPPPHVAGAVIRPRPVTVAPRATTYVNPLAGRTWGTYGGGQELAWAPYVNATGTDKQLLGYIALAPKAKWFGKWIADSDIATKVRQYIANAQHGDPNTLVQMSIFRVKPWEHDACTRLPTAAERASYKTYIDRFAGAVGNTPAAIVLQPDAPFALCAPKGSTVLSNLVAYAAKELSALPRTTVYIEAGAADWPAGPTGVDSAVRILVRGGIQYAHGFALNSTHYDSTTNEVARAAAIARKLAALGYLDRKAVINTSSNGHPFDFGRYTGSDPDNAFVCRSKTAPASSTCVTLGIPPTTHVGAAPWGLSATTNRLARQYVDAYLWIGRPWLYRQAEPFVTSRALQLVRSTPYR